MRELNGIRKDRDDFIVGFTSVVGDFLHAGHSLMLDECKMYCDFLYVGLIADPTIDRPEKNKPVQSLFERWQQVSSHRAVDVVLPLDGEDDLALAIASLPIDVRFVGEDYVGIDFTGKDLCESYGIKIIYNRRKHGLSSSELRYRTEVARNDQGYDRQGRAEDSYGQDEQRG